MNSLSSSMSGAHREVVRTYSPFVGFCFIINYIVGTGFLGIPYIFWHTGIVAGVLTLTAVSNFITFPALWTLEVMARAPAYVERQESIQGEERDESRSPTFEIGTNRRFEVSELCRIFLGKYGGAVYLGMVLVYLWISQWLTAPVAGTAWASLLPLDTGVFRQCINDEFKNVNHPSDGCWNSYALCVLFFGVIVVPISCLDIKEQEIFQVFMAMMRFVLIFCIVIYSIAKEAVDSSGEHHGNKMVDTRPSVPYFGFNHNGFLAAIPVIVYAQMLHLAIPTLTQPILNKRRLVRLYFAVFITTSLIYGTLGVTVAIYQRDNINEVCTLNWEGLTKAGNIGIRILSYFIVLFPSFDVCSAYPLTVIVMANMVDYLITGDASKVPDRLTRTVHRFFWAVTPLIGGVYLSDIVVLDKYSGLLAFFVAFWFPAILQYRSQKLCRDVFGYSDTPYSSWWSRLPFVIVVFVIGVAVTIATVVGFFLSGTLS